MARTSTRPMDAKAADEVRRRQRARESRERSEADELVLRERHAADVILEANSEEAIAEAFATYQLMITKYHRQYATLQGSRVPVARILDRDRFEALNRIGGLA